MENIKAVFLDFDWTLYDHNLHDYNYPAIDVLKQIQKKGIKLFINSARAYYSLRELKILDMLKFDGYGCINGLYCLTNTKTLYAHYINSEILKKIIKICEINHLSYLITTLKETYIKDFKDDLTHQFYETVTEPYPKDISLYNNKDNIIAIQIYMSEDKDILIKEFQSTLRFNRWHPLVVELNDIEPSKKESTVALMKEFNLDKNECVAIGDDINDVDMFNEVKYSICMGNGHEMAKKKAYYTTTNIDDNGIINALKKLNLI